MKKESNYDYDEGRHKKIGAHLNIMASFLFIYDSTFIQMKRATQGSYSLLIRHEKKVWCRAKDS